MLYSILAILIGLLERKDIELLRQVSPKEFSPVIDVLEMTVTR